MRWPRLTHCRCRSCTRSRSSAAAASATARGVWPKAATERRRVPKWRLRTMCSREPGSVPPAEVARHGPGHLTRVYGNRRRPRCRAPECLSSRSTRSRRSPGPASPCCRPGPGVHAGPGERGGDRPAGRSLPTKLRVQIPAVRAVGRDSAAVGPLRPDTAGTGRKRARTVARVPVGVYAPDRVHRTRSHTDRRTCRG